MAKKEEVKKVLKKGLSQFQLIGEAKINDFTFKIDSESKSSDWIKNQLNLGLDCGNGNVVYSELSGGYGSKRDNVIRVHGHKLNEKNQKIDDYENKFTIAWEDRLDEDILETIGDSCFLTIGVEKYIDKNKQEKTFSKKFLSAYDAIPYIQEHLQTGMVVNVKGDLKYSMYNDNVQVKKEIKSIFLSKVDDKSKYKATFTQSILINKDSKGKLDKEKAVYPIYARVIDYTKFYGEKEVKQMIPFAKTFELEVDKIKPENTKKILDKIFAVKKKINEITFEGDLVEGQAMVTITEDDLPDDIKELIDMGVYTLEDAVGKLAIGGSKEKRMILRRPVIKMVGDDENKSAVVMKEENKYSEEDLIFDFMFENDDADDDDNDSDADSVVDSDDSDDDSWLAALGDND
jgi:hypothetical protein